METNVMVGRKIEDVKMVQVVISFDDKAGFAVPLTGLQGALFLKTFGFYLDSETGELTHYTDKELAQKFGLEGD